MAYPDGVGVTLEDRPTTPVSGPEQELTADGVACGPRNGDCGASVLMDSGRSVAIRLA
jgi:hypothetical protein